uniref:LAGLIDADG homing endonuclease n=1 Tax=Termitomyces sp. TaxID=1916073 RepID=A0A386TYH1_9AGAR|nr:hypothetical protein C0995_000087 [Termitomyces sp.]AYE93266.1 hypothetical protein C0995_000043 [Termitomyces sp.]
MLGRVFLFLFLFLFLILMFFKDNSPNSLFILNINCLIYILSYIIPFVFSFIVSYLTSKLKSIKLFRVFIYYLVLTTGLFVLYIIGIVILAYFYLLEVVEGEGLDEIEGGVRSESSDNGGGRSNESPESDKKMSENNDEYKVSGSISKELAKEIAKETGEVVLKGVGTFVDKVAPNIGAAAAGGTVGAAALHASKGLPPVQRLVAIGASSGVAAFGTKVGIGASEAIIKNANILAAERNSQVTEGDRAASPTDNFFVSSPNDISSPLEELFLYQFSLNILIFILIIIFLFLIFNRFVFKYNTDIISSFVERRLSTKWKELFQKYITKSSQYNDRLFLILFILNSFSLLGMIILNLIISSHLLVNGDEFIHVHNYIHNIKCSTFLLIWSVKSTGKIDKDKIIKRGFISSTPHYDSRIHK